MLSWTSNTLMKLSASRIGRIHMLDIQCSFFLLNTGVICEWGIHKMVLCVEEQGTTSRFSHPVKSEVLLCPFLAPKMQSDISTWGFTFISGGLTKLTLFFKLPGFGSLFLLFIVILAFPALSAFIPQTLQGKYKTVIYHPRFYVM